MIKYINVIILRAKVLLFRWGFHISFGLKDLAWSSNSEGFIMERRALKELMYGSIEELMQNNRYYSYSSIGPQYSYWTEAGRAALNDYMDMIAHQMKKCRDDEDNQRSKDLVMKELKS
jgi:hypothetical protein